LVIRFQFHSMAGKEVSHQPNARQQRASSTRQDASSLHFWQKTNVVPVSDILVVVLVSFLQPMNRNRRRAIPVEACSVIWLDGGGIRKFAYPDSISSHALMGRPACRM
jgi:hypothetical protein